MRAYKLSDRALIVLRCIDARTERDDQGVLLRFWAPSNDTRSHPDWLDNERHVISGSDGHIIRALIRHGLCEKPAGSWAYCAATKVG